MRIDNLRKLIEEVSKDKVKYSILMENLEFLMSERIKFVGNDLRAMLNRPNKEIDKEKILESVRKINAISSEFNSEFYFEEDLDKIEAFLRLTILEDIGKEFEKQSKN